MSQGSLVEISVHKSVPQKAEKRRRKFPFLAADVKCRAEVAEKMLADIRTKVPANQTSTGSKPPYEDYPDSSSNFDARIRVRCRSTSASGKFDHSQRGGSPGAQCAQLL
jgi:hypothetical protein